MEAPEPVKVDWPFPELETVREVPLYLDFLRLGFHVSTSLCGNHSSSGF